MNATLTELLKIAETDPLSDLHASSHWQHYGQQVQAERQGEILHLKSSGFPMINRAGLVARGLHWMERLSYSSVTAKYRHFPETWTLAKRLIADLQGHADFEVLKSAAILSVLADHWETNGLSPRTFALIGDGPGFLGALIRRYRPDAVLFHIDFPKMLIFQANTYAQAHPQASTRVLRPGKEHEQAEITFVAPDHIDLISGSIDCGINIASMQEMTAFSVQTYFKFLRQRSTPHSRFYCLNRERKQLPGGEVSDFLQYPWHANDRLFIDETCPFYRYFLASARTAQGPRVGGLRIPFINYFDGDHRHRLVHLAPEGIAQ
jgi:hypothetical protein